MIRKGKKLNSEEEMKKIIKKKKKKCNIYILHEP